MDMSLTVSGRQILSLKLTQSMELLQMNTIEINKMIDEISLSNPFLDVSDYKKGTNREYDVPKEKRSFDLYNNVVAEESLYDYIKFQLLSYNLTKKEDNIADYIINSIDHKGYLTYPIEQVANNLDVHVEEAKKVLAIIKALEPHGIGASSLKECLLIQLYRIKPIPRIAVQIVENHLDNLSKKKYGVICKELSISKEELSSEIDVILSLNPKPGAAFYTNNDAYMVIPDIIVLKAQEGFIASLNGEMIREVSLNDYYKEMSIDLKKPDEIKYLRDQLEEARWLISAVSYRNETLLKTAMFILQRQKEFFVTEKNLVPLRLSDAAEELGLHESTISRAIKDKYILCHKGTVPFSYFFPKAIKTETKAVTPDFIKERLIELINSEDKGKPKSDRKLTDELNEMGITIKRRTVAKYREELNILSTAYRRA